MEPVPEGSIYIWMYTQGLKNRDQHELAQALHIAGKETRDKDWGNYWRGISNSTGTVKQESLINFTTPVVRKENHDIPLTAYGLANHTNPDKRWVPCNQVNRPMIKWGTEGCMTREEALAMAGCVYLAENMRDTNRIVIDCDGDHDKDNIDYETVKFLWQFSDLTHTIHRPGEGMPLSFHLTFITSRSIPIMHFSHAHIDIIGNKTNALRYFKNKVWNNKQPTMMTTQTWETIMDYIRNRTKGTT